MFNAILALLAVLVAAQPSPTPPPTAEPTAAVVEPVILVPEVIAEYPHDTDAFTQGLVWHEGVFYESTGLYGESTLRRVDPETGEVTQRIDLDAADFAEGLALVEDRLIQITWKEGRAYVYDRETFELQETFTYTGEGWGLCYDGEALWMSDGSETLVRRDPATFEALTTLDVTLAGRSVAEWSDGRYPLSQLNELECVDGALYANVWMTDVILRIDAQTGVVSAVVVAANLLPLEARAALADGAVLNGIAYDAEEDIFYITGKRWPSLFAVRFVPAPQS